MTERMSRPAVGDYVVERDPGGRIIAGRVALDGWWLTYVDVETATASVLRVFAEYACKFPGNTVTQTWQRMTWYGADEFETDCALKARVFTNASVGTRMRIDASMIIHSGLETFSVLETFTDWEKTARIVEIEPPGASPPGRMNSTLVDQHIGHRNQEPGNRYQFTAVNSANVSLRTANGPGLASAAPANVLQSVQNAVLDFVCIRSVQGNELLKDSRCSAAVSFREAIPDHQVLVHQPAATQSQQDGRIYREGSIDVLL